MKNDRFRQYIYWGVTAVSVIAVSAVLIFLLFNARHVKQGFYFVIKVLSPVIYGMVFAYLTAPIFDRVRNYVDRSFEKVIPGEMQRLGVAKVAGTVVSLMVLLMVVFGLLSMLIPELIESIIGVVETLPAGLQNLGLWLEQLLYDNPEIEADVIRFYNEVVEYLYSWMRNSMMPNIDKIITEVSSSIFGVMNVLKNLLIGLIVMVYLLNIKERGAACSKKFFYSVFPVKIANKVVEELRYVNKTFSGFIIGKILDSLIIGILCFICLTVMRMPYTLLVSVIIGVTNVIPFFGPFIGAIPSAFLILLVSPMQCLYFLIFILLLQQFDGNILGPKILGDSTGISSFGVLFSILLFGGLFGFVGMIIGVPTFAVLQRLSSELVDYLLERKQLKTSTDAYGRLDYIDTDNRSFINKRGKDEE